MLGLILWGSSMWVLNSVAIHPAIVELFQYGPGWRIGWPTLHPLGAIRVTPLALLSFPFHLHWNCNNRESLQCQYGQWETFSELLSNYGKWALFKRQTWVLFTLQSVWNLRINFIHNSVSSKTLTMEHWSLFHVLFAKNPTVQFFAYERYDS